MTVRIRISVLLSLVIALAVTSAAASEKGTSGGITLTFPSGARAQSMAEAYTASAGDINGIYYNPAAISALGRIEASVFYGRGFFDDDYGGLTYVQPAGPGVAGVSVKYYTTGGIDLDDGGAVRTVKGLSDYLIGVSYAALLGEAVGLGGTIKLLRSTLVEDFTATSVAADVGLTYDVGMSGLVLGAAVTNVGSDLKYRDAAVPLPWALGIGAMYGGTALGSPVVAAVDLLRPREGDLRTRVGFELRPGDLVAVRMGYKFGYDSDTFTVGLGIEVKKLRVNYAAGIAGDVDNLHLVELTYKF